MEANLFQKVRVGVYTAALAAVGVYLLGWLVGALFALCAWLVVAIVVFKGQGGDVAQNARRSEEKALSEGKSSRVHRLMRLVAESSETGRAAVECITKAVALAFFGGIFLVAILPTFIAVLKGHSPVAYGLWETLWRPLAELTAQLPLGMSWCERMRDLGHAERIPYVQHVVAVGYASAVLTAGMFAYAIWKIRTFAALGAFDGLVSAGLEENEKVYKSARNGSIFILVFSIVFVIGGLASHVFGIIINEASSIHVNNYAAVSIFIIINMPSMAAGLMCGMICDYYACGRLWFPTMEKAALLKARMKNG